MASRSRKGADASGRTPGGLAVWRQAISLLETEQFGRAATLFHAARATLEEEGDQMGAAVLTAAEQMCLSCRRAHEEAEAHRGAWKEAKEREEMARRELLSLLALAAGQAAADREWPTEPGAAEAEPAAELTLWQRIRRLFERGRERQRAAASAATDIEAGEAAVPEEAADARPARRKRPVYRRIRGRHRWKRRKDTVTVRRRPGPNEGGPERRQPAAGAARASLVFHSLGPFAVYRDGQQITEWNGLKGLTILKYLVAERGKPVGKEVLMDVLWPDARPEAARRNLHQAIYSLRQALRGRDSEFQHIQFHNDCYRFHPDLDVWIDFVQFEHYARRGQQLEAAERREEAMDAYGIAEELYHGDFLEEDLYEEWALRRREQLRTLYLDLADRLATRYVARGDYTAAVALARKMLAQDRCSEEAHRHLIFCYGLQGQRHLAVRQYQACVEALHDELGLEPSEKTVALYQDVTAG